MTTLQEIKKRNGLTNAAIGKELGCSAGTAGMILQGRHIRVYHDHDIEKLAAILGVTFERCWMAMCESYNTWRGTPGAIHQRADEVRAEVQAEFGLPIEEPRSLATVESVLVVDKTRRIESRVGHGEQDSPLATRQPLAHPGPSPTHRSPRCRAGCLGESP